MHHRAAHGNLAAANRSELLQDTVPYDCVGRAGLDAALMQSLQAKMMNSGKVRHAHE
jgi:hypothetical protein